MDTNDMQIGDRYFLSHHDQGTLVGFINCDEEDMACFQVEGERSLATHRADDFGRFPMLVTDRSREAVRRFLEICGIGLEHVGELVERACLAGVTSIVEPFPDYRADMLQEAGYQVELVPLGKSQCVGPGQWVDHGYKVSWT